MMTLDDLQILMDAISTGDKRTGASKDEIKMWAVAAQMGRWTLDTALRALVQFRLEHPGEWVEQGHLHEIIKQARSKAALSFVVPDEPEDVPPGWDYPKWYRARRDEHIDRILAGWAKGEPIPEPAAANEIREQRALTGGSGPLELPVASAPPELRADLRKNWRKLAEKRPPPPVQQLRPTTKASLDPDTLALVRRQMAEMNQVREQQPAEVGNRDSEGADA